MEKKLSKLADAVAELILESEHTDIDIDSLVGPEPAVKTEDGASVQFTMYSHEVKKNGPRFQPGGSTVYTVTITAKYESEQD